jgi:hypothetical protein
LALVVAGMITVPSFTKEDSAEDAATERSLGQRALQDS